MILRDLKIFFIFSLLLPLPLLAQENDSIESDEVDTLELDTTAVTSPALSWPENVKEKIAHLIKSPMFNTTQLGIEVYDLTADSVIFAHNNQQRMRPASTEKLLTAITAIDQLGGSYQFRTMLYYAGSIANNTLTGDVYCVGGFDPRFNSDDMNAFVESIKRMGVDTIRGGIYGDVSMKDSKKYGKGWCWDDDEEVLSPLLISRKDLFIERFISELTDANVFLDVKTSTSRLPNNAYNICTRFHSLDQILMRMMKESDNLYAESMFYQIAATTGSKPATDRQAVGIIKNLITKIGFKPSDYDIADGSGLSLYNYVTPELEVAFLKYAYKNSNIYLHLYPSLPIAGEDGTLKKRMRSGFASGNVHAKTGSVTGVSSLAGYCTASNGHKLCFCIINQGLNYLKNGRAFQDRICQSLCQP